MAILSLRMAPKRKADAARSSPSKSKAVKASAGANMSKREKSSFNPLRGKTSLVCVERLCRCRRGHLELFLTFFDFRAGEGKLELQDSLELDLAFS